jgi:hypothetical protein
MKLEFLGDAFDYWKGALFSRLQREGILVDFMVDPMLTDPENWRTSDFRLYADLLQITEDQILRHERKLQKERAQYFAEITHTGDLFLDPDTGIDLRHARHNNIERYVKVSEIHQLIRGNLPRVLCIYQHLRGKKIEDIVRELRLALAEGGTRVYGFSYKTPPVAMLFMSVSRSRIKVLNQYFRNYLGRHSKVKVAT